LKALMIKESKYIGCFKGLAIGDAYGANYEGGIIERFIWLLVGKTSKGLKRYTDDTQMAMDIASSFLSCKGVDQNHLAQTFASNYQWSRGYGPSAAKLLKGIAKGQHWQQLNRKKFKEGSMGNGAAMRAPIVGLCHPFVEAGLMDRVKSTAEITHAHPIAIEGAEIIASTTVMALYDLSSEEIIDVLFRNIHASIYRKKLDACIDLLAEQNTADGQVIKKRLGNGMLAIDSCITAIYYSLKFRESSLSEMLRQIYLLGGDVDTIAAMAGAIWGASNGSDHIESLAKHVEDIEKIHLLAKNLYQNYQCQLNTQDHG
jgi:poly(ADP-ribose) glycohydrolase ARH3